MKHTSELTSVITPIEGYKGEKVSSDVMEQRMQEMLRLRAKMVTQEFGQENIKNN